MCEEYDPLDSWPEGTFIYFDVSVKFENGEPFVIHNFKLAPLATEIDTRQHAQKLAQSATKFWFEKHMPNYGATLAIEDIWLTGGTITLPYKHGGKKK